MNIIKIAIMIIITYIIFLVPVAMYYLMKLIDKYI